MDLAEPAKEEKVSKDTKDERLSAAEILQKAKEARDAPKVDPDTEVISRSAGSTPHIISFEYCGQWDYRP